MLEGVIPPQGGVTQPKGLDGRVGQMALLMNVIQGKFPRRSGEVIPIEGDRFVK
jgi:hypothetical protein